MKQFCTLCKNDFQLKEKSGNGNRSLLGNVCETCLERLTGSNSVDLSSFLESLNIPVMAVNENGLVITANTRLKENFHQNGNIVEGEKGGNVLNCRYAFEPGGCGNSVHCDGCTIRNCVMETHKTGKSFLNVRAFREIKTDEGIVRAYCLITTEKNNDVVFLSIDNMMLLD